MQLEPRRNQSEVLARLREPIVQAPMAGGPSTPQLAAAVCNAGGFGFLALANMAVKRARAQLAALREETGQPFGVNLLIAADVAVDERALEAYATHLAPQADRYGVSIGRPGAAGDDDREAKLELIERERPAAVSFAFGCPARAVVDRIHEAGPEVWITVTDPSEAREAEAAGADALVVQGLEAGGHRGSFVDLDGFGELGLLALLRLVADATDLPMVAAGGLGDARAVAAVLAAGAAAAQLGTAFLTTPEAGTSPAHRAALAQIEQTGLTRAYTGRRARGLVNHFHRENSPAAPSAYPQVAELTGPLRASAIERDDPEGLNLWAGQAHVLARDLPAGDLVRRWGADARAALREACERWPDEAPARATGI